MYVGVQYAAGILLATIAMALTAHADSTYLPTTAMEELEESSVPYSDDGYFIPPMTQIGQDSALTTPVASNADETELTTVFTMDEADINVTVEEVQKILAANPTLPRLSTQEIVDIMYNITEDPDNKTSPKERKSRDDYRRALMVVLPFSADNLSDTSIQELYTKRPITRIIANKTDGSLPSTNFASNYDPQLSKKPTRLPQEVHKLKKNQSEPEQYPLEDKPTKIYSSKYRPPQEKEHLLHTDLEVQAPNHRYPEEEKTEHTLTLQPIQQFPSSNGLHVVHFHEIEESTTQKYLNPIRFTSTQKPEITSLEPNKFLSDTVYKQSQQQQQNIYHAVATTPKYPYHGQFSSTQYHGQHPMLSVNSLQQHQQHQNQHAVISASNAPIKQNQQHHPTKRRRRPQISNHSVPIKSGGNNLSTRMPPIRSKYTTPAASEHQNVGSTITPQTLQTGENYFSTLMPMTPSTNKIAVSTGQTIKQHNTRYQVVNSDAQTTQTKVFSMPPIPITTSSIDSPNTGKYQDFETSTRRQTQAPVRIHNNGNLAVSQPGQKYAQNFETSTLRQAETPVRIYNDGNVEFQPVGHKHVHMVNNFQPTVQNYVVSTTTSSYTTGNQQQIDIGLPNDMRNVLASMSVGSPVQDSKQTQSSMLFITPSPLSQAELLETGITRNPQNNATTEANIHDNVREVLAAIGLFPSKEAPGSKRYHSTSSAAVKTPTTPDASVAAESLTQEMKDLLMSLGLLPSPNEDKHSEPVIAITTEPSSPHLNPEPTINPSSYLSFKPLPIARDSGEYLHDDLMSSDMKQFLATFGLVPMSETGREASSNTAAFHGVPRARSQKSLESDTDGLSVNSNKHNKTSNGSVLTNEMPSINTEIMSDDMMAVLENLGLIPNQSKKPDEDKKTLKKVYKSIYKPSTHYAMLNHTKEETQRLNKLLDIIKHLTKENGTLTPEEIQELNTTFSIPLMTVPSTSGIQRGNRLQTDKNGEKTVTLDQVKDAPDPLFLEELFPTNEQRNDVKRQQGNNTESDTSTPSNETSSSSSSSNSTGPSFSDLADSFGGGETAPANADVSKDLPTPKPNGLYFLLDWHSFLEVGEEGKDKVNLRFEPQIGNSRNFLPVNVP